MQLSSKILLNQETIRSANLCDRFSSDDLKRIGDYVWDGYFKDKTSRMTWERRMDAAMNLAMQVQVDKSFPWPGCSNVIFPLITIGALQFSAQAYPNLINGTRIVKYRVVGKDLGPVRERARRISAHMSWQVTEQDEEWEDQHDKLFINIAIVGSAFIKSYYDSSKGYPVDEFVMARDLVIDYGAKSVEKAARKTHVIQLYRNDIYEKVRRGTFRDVLDEAWFRGNPGPKSQIPSIDKRRGVVQSFSDHATQFTCLEQHCSMDLDDDGYEEPYIVTIEETSRSVLRLVARFENDTDVERNSRGQVIKITPTEYFTKYTFIPSPDGGIYDLGFGIFLGPINEAVNSGINQLLDNGTMQNSIGGFLGRGAKIRGGVYTMAPWEWKRVDSTGDDLRKNLVPYPERQPSTVMFQLVGLLIEYANRIMGTVDTQVGENPGQNTPAQTFQGMQEAGMRVYKVIFKRQWRCMKQEFKKRYLLNKLYTRSHEDFGPASDFIRREDYQGSPDQIAPVANPNITSTTLKLSQAMAVKQDSMTTPGYDIPEVTREFLDALDVGDSIDRLYPGPDKVPPLPNPKLAVEQAKMQVKMQELELRKQELVLSLVEEKRLNNAKILHLEAQAAKFLKEAGNADSAHKLEVFKVAIDALKDHGEMMNERIAALTTGGGGESGETSTDQRSGVPGMAQPPGNTGVPGGVPAPMASGTQGPMG